MVTPVSAGEDGEFQRIDGVPILRDFVAWLLAGVGPKAAGDFVLSPFYRV